MVEEVKEAAIEKEDTERKRTILAYLTVALAVLILALLLYFFRGAIVKPAEVVSKKPTFLFSIYGKGDMGPLSKPLDVAVNPDENKIYVTDTGNKRVAVFDLKGNPLFTIKNLKGGEKLVEPVYLALSSKGNLYVVDRNRNAIFIFTPEGKFLKKFTPLDETLAFSPLGITLDNKDNLYITDVAYHRLLVFDKKGKLKKKIGKAGITPNPEEEKGKFYWPNDITISKNKQIYVSDSNNRRVQIISSKGKFLSIIPTGGLPRGIVLDAEDNVLVVDTFAHSVNVYSSRGTLKFGFGKEGTGDGEFLYPNGIDFKGGRIYVTDRENNRIQVWK